jgi:hypothetical protein
VVVSTSGQPRTVKPSLRAFCKILRVIFFILIEKLPDNWSAAANLFQNLLIFTPQKIIGA